MAKKKTGKHLQFYMDCMKNGRLKDYGLCNSFPTDLLTLFEPTETDYKQLAKEGLSILYWASGVSVLHINDDARWHSFTPLRQTIVLFMAAMSGEL